MTFNADRIVAVLAWLLVVFFLAGAGGNFFVNEQFAADYARWGYPAWFHYVTATLEFSSAVLLALRRRRAYGAALGACVMGAAAATTLWHGEFLHAIAPLTVLALALSVARWSAGTATGRLQAAAG